MGEQKHFEYEFNPEFSEYNPIFAELKQLKNNLQEKRESFLQKILDKMSSTLLVQLD